ncbi:putative reverse transcriptase domain-containing protein, partial [Tanacetum coccineum]
MVLSDDDVRIALNDRLKGIRMEYLPQTFWSQRDKVNARAMIHAIEKRLKTRRIMRSLERFVGGRPYGGNLKKVVKLKYMFQDFRYSDTARLSRSDEVLKLKNFKKDATLKLSKSSNQEWYEHVGPEVASPQDGKVSRWQRVTNSSATSDVTTHPSYTDSEPASFLGSHYEEISEGGEHPRVLAHDPDYVPEPIYPEYIPLEDDHEFPAEEQPLPPIDSPTTESPGYVTESDPEEDPEEYEDDETEDGPVDYPMDGGDDGDDDDGDSSGDDARDEDEDEEDEEEEEEHLAPADSTVIPADEPVFPPEGTEPIIPPPSTDITIGARITVRPQISISLPSEAEVERLLTMTTPSPSPPISLSPPSAGERLARCMAPPAHSPPLPPSSGCLTQIQTLRIASTQALIDAVTAALPPPSLPPLPPSLSIPSPVDRRDDIPESEQPPRKRLHLSTICSRYEIGESSTARPARGQGIDYGFVSTVDAEERRQGIRDVGYGIRDTWVDPAEAVPEIAPMTVGEVNTRVVGLAELHERDTQDLYALLEDAQDSRSRISQRVEMNSQRVDLLMGDRMTLQETVWMLYGTLIQTQHQVHETRFQMQQAEIEALRKTDHRHQAHMVETFRVMRDMRREISDMQVVLLAHREHRRRARQPRPDARIPNIQDACGMMIVTSRTEGVVGLTRWIEKMESVFNISGCAIENLGEFAMHSVRPRCWMKTLSWPTIDGSKNSAPNAERAVLTNKNIRKADEGGEEVGSSRNNYSRLTTTLQKHNVAKVYNMGTGEKKPYGGNLPKCTKCHFHHNGMCTQKCHKCNKVGHLARDYRSSGNTNVANTQKGNGANPKGNGCFECGAPGHFKRDCPKLKNKDGGNGNVQGWVYAVGNAKKRGNASGNPYSNVVTSTFLLNNHYASILFDTGADRSFIFTAFSSLINIAPTPLENNYDVELADGKIVGINTIIR